LQATPKKKLGSKVYTEFLLDYGFQQSAVNQHMLNLQVEAVDKEAEFRMAPYSIHDHVETHLFNRGGGGL
jgi:hypothetical protein